MSKSLKTLANENGFKSIEQLSLFCETPVRTLHDWLKTKPVMLEMLVFGAGVKFKESKTDN